VKFLRRLLPILSPSPVPPQNDEVITKVIGNLDYYLPFRQHAPSLKHARLAIYANDRLSSNDGIGFFNILAFRGVFFGSPFAQSDRYRWFDSLSDWEHFQESGKGKANNHKGEEYYVNKTCYGQCQAGRQLSLLSSYWDQRLRWNDMFNKPEKPTVMQVFRWLTSQHATTNETSKKKTTVTLFPNIGDLTALLICGDLVEAGILLMPSAREWAESIDKMGKGSKSGMVKCGLVREGCKREEFCGAFASLDQALQIELTNEEKDAMGYNIIMLEHALCKIKRIGVNLF
jgi:hypothetical protein